MSRTQISATALFALPLTLALACGNIGCATGTSAPRDEALIKRSIVDSVVANPAFASLADNPHFKLIVKNLEEIAR